VKLSRRLSRSVYRGYRGCRPRREVRCPTASLPRARTDTRRCGTASAPLSSLIGYPEAIRELSRIGYPEAIGACDLHALLLSSLRALDESRVRASICSAPCARACAALAPPPIPIPDRLSGGYPRAIEDRLSGSYRRARLAHSSPVFLARSMSHMRLHAPRTAPRASLSLPPPPMPIPDRLSGGYPAIHFSLHSSPFVLLAGGRKIAILTMCRVRCDFAARSERSLVFWLDSSCVRVLDRLSRAGGSRSRG
jgi:hypothetical protein